MRFLLFLFIIGCTSASEFAVLRCTHTETACTLSTATPFKTKEACEEFVRTANEVQKKVTRICQEI